MATAASPAHRSIAWRTFSLNSIVQAGEQLVNIVFGLAVTVYLARVLGPELFGVWSLCVALIRIALTCLAYGLDIVVLRHCSAEDRPDHRFLAAVLTVRGLNAVAITVATALVVVVAGGLGTLTGALLLCMLPGLLLAPLEALEFWFRARKDAVTPALARIIAIVVGSGLKIALLVAGASIELVGAAHALQIGLIGAILLAIYLARGHRLSFDTALPTETRRLYRDAWPLFVTALGYLIYARTDIVMLAWLKGEAEAGIFAAASRITEALQLGPVILMTAASPFLFATKRQSIARFVELYRVLLTAFNIVFLAVAIAVCLLAPWGMRTIFGPAYAAAGQVLAIQVFALVFVAQGVATEYWWIARRRASVTMWRTLAGAVTNVALNAALIPFWGASGAAVATVVSVWVAGVGAHLILGRPGLHLLRLQLVPSPKLFGHARSLWQSARS